MILLMGIPGSGKGTQGNLLAATRKYQVISTGELLRTYGSTEQHARMQAGEILGDEEVTALLDKALAGLEDQDRTILDGYPRRINQAEWLIEQSRAGRFHLDYVIYLMASPESVTQRLQARGRKDDHDGAIQARFIKYEQETMPILEFLRGQGVKIVEVNAEQPIEDVHQELLAIDFSQSRKE